MNFISILKVSIPLGVLLFLIMYFLSLKSQIDSLEIDKRNLINDNISKDVTIINLESAIEVSNKQFESIMADNSRIKNEILMWKNKPEKIVYKNKNIEKILQTTEYSEASCLDFSKEISNIKYEDLK